MKDYIYSLLIIASIAFAALVGFDIYFNPHPVEYELDAR